MRIADAPVGPKLYDGRHGHDAVVGRPVLFHRAIRDLEHGRLPFVLRRLDPDQGKHPMRGTVDDLLVVGYRTSRGHHLRDAAAHRRAALPNVHANDVELELVAMEIRREHQRRDRIEAIRVGPLVVVVVDSVEIVDVVAADVIAEEELDGKDHRRLILR